MPRPVVLFSGQWTDLSLEELAQKLNEWGYQGIDLCCWGNHFDVQRATDDEDYCQQQLDLLARFDLQLPVLSNHRVGQAVSDRIEPRHQRILPERIWSDGDSAAINQRAADEMIATFRAAQKLGVSIVGGFTGSPLWPGVMGYPANTPELVERGFVDFAAQWNRLLDVCADAGVRFAMEVHPGQIAYDLHTAERTLEALDGREEFGFTFDPSHLHWMGVDPVEFLRRFPERIYHVHIKDIALNLNGRNSLLCSNFPYGDSRRGWEFRAPGHGGLDWEAIIRTLNQIGYEGPLAVEFSDAAMQRDYGAEEACKFVRRLDFERAT